MLLSYFMNKDRSFFMETVTVSPKFRVVIPRSIREKLQIEVGRKVHAIALQDRVELIPVRPVRSMRGFLKGLDTRITRDSDHV
jgi:AbrB family looped-hinge helix DNA binding protein